MSVDYSMIEGLAAKGYSTDAIVHIMGRGTPVGTVRAMVSHARRSAARRLENERWAKAFEKAEADRRSAAASRYRVIDVRGTGRSIARILEDTAQRHGLIVRDLLCASRTPALVRPRHEAMFLCALETTKSLPQIGQAFGGRDHTTVMKGIRQHAKRNGLPLPRGMTPGGAV